MVRGDGGAGETMNRRAHMGGRQIDGGASEVSLRSETLASLFFFSEVSVQSSQEIIKKIIPGVQPRNLKLHKSIC